MKASDVLVHVLAPMSFYLETESTKGDVADLIAIALIGQTPPGEGVYIAPDGTLMRAEGYWPDDPGRKLKLYRLVSIEGADPVDPEEG